MREEVFLEMRIRSTNSYFMKRRRKTAVAAFFFLLPATLIYLFFIGGPVLISLFLSFTDYSILKGTNFVGIDNYRTFFSDSRMSTIVLNTVKYAIILIPIHTVISLILAVIVDKQTNKFMSVLTRSSVYFPFLITTASASAAWFYMFDGNTGVFNYFLTKLGLPTINWLTNRNWPYVALAIYSFWKYIGEPFLFYLIGLQGISEDYMEAAQVDGANSLQAFFYIKLPLLTPTCFYVLIIKTIHCFQVFEEPYLLTSGGPGDATRSMAMYLYDNAFVKFNMGYASTIAVFIFMATLIVTILLFVYQKKWVCYDT